MQNTISIKGAKVHNLKDIDLEIPKHKLVLLTGVSGSGKSSLAFDTIYAEGQRRYVESLSAYARQFLGVMEKPDVERIDGLSPAISIDQKTSGSNPRSTVGTVTEIYDYMRLLYGKVGISHCPTCGKVIKSQTIHEIVDNINHRLKETLDKSDDDSVKFQILSPVVQSRKGEHRELFEELLSKGFIRVNIDGKQHSLDEIDNIKLDKNKKHKIDVVIDRLAYRGDSTDDENYLKRLTDAIEMSSSMTEGESKISINDEEYFYSENNSCTTCKVSYPAIKPATFSFNSPHGACAKCTGLGKTREVQVQSIYNPELTILQGGIFPWSNQSTTPGSWHYQILETVAKEHKFSLKDRLGDLPQEILDLLFYGKGAHQQLPY